MMDAKGEKKSRRRNPRGEGERLRAEILEAATRVLARLGQDEPFSLRAVAKEAKIAPPSVYLHFADKTVLLRAVIEQLFADLIALRDEAEEVAAATGGGPWERLLARSRSYVRYGMERTGHYRVLYEGRAILRLEDPKTLTFGLAELNHTAGLIREITAKSPARKRVSADPVRLALLLWTGMHGIVSLQINKPTIDWPEAATLAEQMARALIQP